MKLSDAEIRELFQRKTAREESRAADCLGEDVLVRAANGELDTAGRQRVADHIAHCSDCAREFRIARSLLPLESAARRELPEMRPATSWLAIAASALLAIALPALVWLVLERDRLRGEVAELKEGGRLVRPVLPVLPGGRDVRPPEDPAIAELSRPQIDVPIVDLDADVTRGTNDPQTTIEVPPTAGVIALILHLPEETSAPVEVEVLDGSGRVVTAASVGARRNRSIIALALHRKILREGNYAIRVGKKTTFRFRIDSL